MQQDAIEVPVPFVWRVVGAIYLLGVVVAAGGSIHFLSAGKAKGGFDSFVFVMHLALTPLLVTLLVPCLIQRYPAWIVRIYGRVWLLKLVDQCRRQLGRNRNAKASVSRPTSWMRDQRWIWLAIVSICILLGAANARF